MSQNIRVVCLVERYWDTVLKEYHGQDKSGTLIDISLETMADKTIPVGIVQFDDNTFESVPINYIKKEIKI
ncbi:MAG: hypothetical protein WAX04_06585 [Oscillospiraceae bacterium]